jgi:integrase
MLPGIAMKLDAKTIASLTLPEGRDDYTWWDDDLVGFGYRLRRRLDGRPHASWVAQYRADDGRTRKPGIVAAKTTPPEARNWARKILAKVELGQDPQAEREAKRQEAKHTVRSVVTAYLEAKEPELRPTSFRVTKLYLTGPYFRPLHPLAITTVTRTNVAACIRTISRTHSTATAAAARRALSAFFAWAIAEGVMGDEPNPVDGSHKPADPKPRDHVPTPVELATIWRNCADDDFGRITRLLILLGSRRAEVGGMRWSELDLDAGVWTLPATRSKNNRAHEIALPASALEIIKSVPRINRDHLFGSWAGEGFTSWSRGKQELDHRLGKAVRPWHLHDIRRGVATSMADLGVEPHHVEAVLNHYSGRKGPAGVYNRSRYEQAVKSALLRWSEHITALVEGRESNVLALSQRA